MKIKLKNGKIYPVRRAEIVENARLEIDFEGTEPSAEELQEIFSMPYNLITIELLTDDEMKTGEVTDWSVYCGIMMLGELKTVILAKQEDTVKQRLDRMEANLITATERANTAKEMAEENAGQVTDLQMALCELYEVQEGIQEEETEGQQFDQEDEGLD